MREIIALVVLDLLFLFGMVGAFHGWFWIAKTKGQKATWEFIGVVALTGFVLTTIILSYLVG